MSMLIQIPLHVPLINNVYIIHRFFSLEAEFAWIFLRLVKTLAALRAQCKLLGLDRLTSDFKVDVHVVTTKYMEQLAVNSMS